MKYLEIISITGCQAVLNRPNIHFIVETDKHANQRFRYIKPSDYQSKVSFYLDLVNKGHAQACRAILNLQKAPESLQTRIAMTICNKGKATVILEKDLKNLYWGLMENHRAEQQFYNPCFQPITPDYVEPDVTKPEKATFTKKALSTAKVPQPRQPDLKQIKFNFKNLFQRLQDTVFYFFWVTVISLVTASFNQSLVHLITNPFYPLIVLIVSIGFTFLQGRDML